MATSAQYQASLERVLTRLEQATGREARFEGGQWKALCPAHPDRTPSLTVKWSNGATMVHCHAGCTGTKPHVDPTPVLDALQLTKADLFDEPLADRDRYRGVTNLTDKRRQRAQVTKPAPEKYEVAPELAPRIIPKAKPKPGEKVKVEGDGEPYAAAWHLYQDPDTLEVAWAAIRIVQPLKGGGYDKAFVYVHRDDTVTGKNDKGKRFCLGESPTTGRKRFETLPDGWVTKMPAEARLQTLFHLGDLRDDVANGKTIYVVEGESDTAAGRAVKMATTTAPKGNGKWQPHHSTELIGADVVIVADCDDAGIQGAETIARSLVGKAASIRVVQAREGKDLRDHLAAGYGPDDLVEIDLGIPELHPERTTPATPTDSTTSADRSANWNTGTDYSDAPNGDYIDDPDAPNEKPRYLIRRGEIVERTWKAMGRGEDVVYHARYKTILKCAAWVTEVTEADDGSEDNGRNLVKETRDSVLHLERFSPHGELVAEMDLRFPQEMLDRGEWVRNWPWPDTFVGHKKADKEKALSGIYAAHAAPTRRTKVYVATGWRETETGPIFVHGSGAIGRGGTVDVDVDLDMILALTALPDPTEDGAALRAAYWNGTDPLRDLPAKIAAPLRGQVFASLVSPMSMVTHLHGPRGTKKTALARVHLQHFAPGMNFDDNVKEMVSGASGVSSPKGMARMLGRAKDVVLLVDDLAPDRGGAAEARTRLAELARQVYNRSAATKATFNPREVVNELPPRCSLLTTGEITADGSAGTRCLNIAVELGVVSDKLITDLESRARVQARGILGASYLMWVAQRRDELMVWREELRGQFLSAWRDTLAELPYGSDVLSRVAEAARDYSVGELFLLTFLLDRGAITEDEADEMWEWSVKGIREAATAIEAETSDVAAGLIWTIKELIATGRAHLTDRNGDSPVIDGDRYAPQRWGYTAQQRPGSGVMGQPEVLWRENGTRIGVVDDNYVYLIPAEVEYQARQHRQRAERAWTETTSSLAAALDTRGWLTTHIDPRTGKKHRSVGRELGGRTMRVWHLSRELFDGPEGEGPGDGVKPTPVDARLQRRPSWLEIPLDEPAEERHEVELPAAVGYEAPTATPSARPASARTETASPLQPVQASPPAGRAAGDVTPAAPSAAASPASTPRVPARPVTPQGATTMTEPDWTHRLAVFDLDAVYLPERDGEVTVLPLAEPPTAADLAEYAVDFDLHRGTTSVGQVILSPRLSDALGLVVDEDLTAVVERLGLNNPEVRPDLKDKKSRRNVAALEQLAERGEKFVAELRAAGWQVDTLRPRFTIRRPDPDEPDNGRKTRVFGIVLDAFSYMWESKEDDMSGPDQRKYPLPDPDDHPADYCTQLAARLGRIGELLGVSWQSSAAATGGELVERGAVRMPKPKGGEREIDWRRQGKEFVPQDAIKASKVRGQMMWEPHNKWSRTPGEDELAAATELWLFDERGSYLPRAGSLQFGYGQPEQIDPAQLLDLLRAGKQPYGLSLIDLPMWDVASFMPPHPDMAEKQVNRRWTTLRTPWLLANAHKHSAYDFTEDLGGAIQEVWFWPKTHRIYGQWAEQVRNARVHAGEQAEFAAAQAANAESAGERAMWTVEAENWFAVEAMTKNVYAGYIGRLSSPRIIAKENSQRYHYHYRPVGQASIWGEQRVQAWLKLAKYEARTGLAPLFASGTDSYGFLAPGLGGVIPEPDVDDGKFGKLRVKHKVLLTDAMRERLLQGAPGYQVLDVELARLAKAGETA